MPRGDGARRHPASGLDRGTVEQQSTSGWQGSNLDECHPVAGVDIGECEIGAAEDICATRSCRDAHVLRYRGVVGAGDGQCQRIGGRADAVAYTERDHHDVDLAQRQRVEFGEAGLCQEQGRSIENVVDTAHEHAPAGRRDPRCEVYDGQRIAIRIARSGEKVLGVGRPVLEEYAEEARYARQAIDHGEALLSGPIAGAGSVLRANLCHRTPLRQNVQ